MSHLTNLSSFVLFLLLLITTILEKLLTTPRRDGKNRTALVYFVGGVTYAEVSCFRYLSEKTGLLNLDSLIIGLKFIVGTTQFINGNRLVDSFKDEQGNLLRPESLLEGF